MAKVANWQLGREMEYPYEERRPSKQFAFVINTNRCIGCQTCTMACKSTWTFGKGPWEPATRAYGPTVESPQNLQYLAGGYLKIVGKS